MLWRRASDAVWNVRIGGFNLEKRREVMFLPCLWVQRLSAEFWGPFALFVLEWER